MKPANSPIASQDAPETAVFDYLTYVTSLVSLLLIITTGWSQLEGLGSSQYDESRTKIVTRWSPSVGPTTLHLQGLLLPNSKQMGKQKKSAMAPRPTPMITPQACEGLPRRKRLTVCTYEYKQARRSGEKSGCCFSNSFCWLSCSRPKCQN